MEEIGARSQIFTIDNVSDNRIRYCEWLLKNCTPKEVKLHEVLLPEAIDLLVKNLGTPLQIKHYLTQTLEKAYLVGCKPITPEVVQSVLSPDIDGLEAKLARHGYNISTLCDVLNAKPSEVKSYLRGVLTPSKSQEFHGEIQKLGVI